MNRKLTLILNIVIMSMLLIDIFFAIYAQVNHNLLWLIRYAIVSSIILFILFSIHQETSKVDLKLYAIGSLISTTLYIVIFFGRYVNTIGTLFIFTVLFSIATTFFYTFRAKYRYFHQMILINLVYMITRFSLILVVIFILALQGIGSI